MKQSDKKLICDLYQLANGLEARLKFERPPRVLRDAAKRLTEIVNATERQQARIDSLMLEFCPDEMTKDQKLNWANSLRRLPPTTPGVNNENQG